MKFNYVKFWVQIFNVPLMCMTRDIRMFIGRQIVCVREIDVGASGDCMGRYIRVHVGVNIDKPLKWCLRVDLGGSNGIIGNTQHSFGPWLRASSPPKVGARRLNREAFEKGNRSTLDALGSGSRGQAGGSGFALEGVI
ncbi:hypothetical protein ACOSQ4_019704 [Xanthoceras sorbifolium]